MISSINRFARRIGQRLGTLPHLLITALYSNTADLYEALGHQPGVGNFLNLGWWTDELRRQETTEDTITEACRELARQIARFGRLGPDQRILDAGFGFGEQDVLFADEFDCDDITGINITPHHVHEARKRIRARELEDLIKFHIGNAVDLPYPRNFFDRLIALESAFHFPTRTDFLREASRVLEPGGMLVSADIIRGDTVDPADIRDSIMSFLHESYWNLPAENRITTTQYRKQLTTLNFTDIEIRDVSDRVIDPWISNYGRWRLNQEFRLVQTFGEPFLKFVETYYESDAYRYVFVRATLRE